ncbi:MAG: class I SAM-dependent methyltransferase [Prevotellaceae bacterium]|nr:class I SAM-dependent methyltransferase [Prevotellaceae bacterium]
MQKILKYISQQFGNPSGFGGQISTFIMNCINRRQYRATLENLHISENDVVLDIGFGNGFLIRQLAKQKPKKIYGIEISEDMIVAAKKRNQNAVNQGKIELFKAGVEKLPFADESIDKIYTVNTVYFWENFDIGIAEIKRVLKPNGIFINTIYTQKHLSKLIITKYGFEKYDVEYLQKYTAESGLKIVQTIKIERNKSLCITAKKY